MQNNPEPTFVKPWVQWLLDHNLFFLLYPIFLVLAPVVILCSIGSHINTSARDLNYELQSIKGYKKHE